MDRARKWFSALAWAVLTFTVLVVLGGAVVRATGSGDGCGDTWPVCTDRIFPVDPEVETIIEFGHRLMSGAAIIGIVVLFFWARRLYQRGDPVRIAASAAGVLIILESLIGASLVLFGWVDTDASIGRMIVVPLHLVNTSLLTGSLSLAAWWSSGNPPPQRPASSPEAGRLLWGAAALLVVATIGALNALADTLYPSDDFLSGVRDEFSTGAPLAVQTRVVHPVVAILVGLFIAYLVMNAPARSGTTGRLARLVAGLIVVQFAIGILNVLLATPLETQVVHLAMANAIWISYVLFSASLLGEPARASEPVTSPP
jgi:heme A synthase